jgi:hypothetical protein
MSFMLLDVAPGAHNIQMRFETPLENRVGQILFVLSALVIAALCALSFRLRPKAANSLPA